MSAFGSSVYPLVRKWSAFSTRSGVRARPSRSGSSPVPDSSGRTASCMVLLGLIESPPENRALSGAVVTVRTWPDRPLAHHASASQPSRRAAWRHETPLSQQLVPTPTRPVPARAGGDGALVSVLKSLEIQKTLGSE